MKIAFEIEFIHHRCDKCGAFWAVESARNYKARECPCCATDNITAANERADAAGRSAAATKANVTRKLNRRS